MRRREGTDSAKVRWMRPLSSGSGEGGVGGGDSEWPDADCALGLHAAVGADAERSANGALLRAPRGIAELVLATLALDRTERNSLLATLHVVEKTPTRHAEALFLRFNPPQAFHAEGGAVGG